MLAQIRHQRVHVRDGELNFSLAIRAWTHSTRRIPHEPAKSQPQSDRDSFPVGHGPPLLAGGERTRPAKPPAGQARLNCVSEDTNLAPGACPPYHGTSY